MVNKIILNKKNILFIFILFIFIFTIKIFAGENNSFFKNEGIIQNDIDKYISYIIKENKLINFNIIDLEKKYIENTNYFNNKINFIKEFNKILKNSNNKKDDLIKLCLNFGKKNLESTELGCLNQLKLFKSIIKNNKLELNKYYTEEEKLIIKPIIIDNIFLKPLSQKYKNEGEILKEDINKGYLIGLDGLFKNVELNKKGMSINYIIKEDLGDLINQYYKDNNKKIYISSAYRNISLQKQLYNYYNKKYGKNQNVSTYPGTSEHHLGTTIDFGLGEKTINYDWLKNNAYKFGFVQSYNNNSFKDTGIKEEIWHYRWVGKKIAYKYNEYIKNNKNSNFITFLRNYTGNFPFNINNLPERIKKFNDKYLNKYNNNIDYKNCLNNYKNNNSNLDLLYFAEKGFCNKFIKEIKLSFGGDIMLSRSIGYYNKKEGYDRIFQNINPNSNIDNDTVLFYNLESPFSNNDKDVLKRTFIFGANINNIKVLNKLNNNGKNKMVLSLSNNHITNSGYEGIITTKNILNKNGILFTGIGYKNYIEVIDNNGNKLCFQSYTYDGGLKKLNGNNILIKPLDINLIKEDINNMKKNYCELKIIGLHWGNEYKFEPTNNQKEIAHSIIDFGADLIIGSHSHILGKIEEYKNKKIYYSLGNFIFDQDWGNKGCQKGMDCIYDKNYKKNTVPTYISTKVSLSYKFNDNGEFLYNSEQIDKYLINNGKFLKKY